MGCPIPLRDSAGAVGYDQLHDWILRGVPRERGQHVSAPSEDLLHAVSAVRLELYREGTQSGRYHIGKMLPCWGCSHAWAQASPRLQPDASHPPVRLCRHQTPPVARVCTEDNGSHPSLHHSPSGEPDAPLRRSYCLRHVVDDLAVKYKDEPGHFANKQAPSEATTKVPRIESMFRRSCPAQLSSACPWARVPSPRWGLRSIASPRWRRLPRCVAFLAHT